MLLYCAALLSAFSWQVVLADNTTTVSEMNTEVLREELIITEPTPPPAETPTISSNTSSWEKDARDIRLIKDRTILDLFALQHRLIRAVYG